MHEKLKHILIKAVEMGASDVHISSNNPVVFRVNGDLVRVSEDSMSPQVVSEYVFSVLPAEKKYSLTKIEDVDISSEVEGLSRFRINVFAQRKGPSMSIRLLSYEIKDLEELQLPTELKGISKREKGLFLVTGPTGSGKSTTIASMINFLNKRTSRHIITLEDPIEYFHENKKSLIQQRELGTTINSFEEGIRSALRQDPNVIVVGEMRDLETIRAALTAAETGHLVISTLHTSSTHKTIDRIIDVFPPEQQSQIKNQLASTLIGIMSQKLLKTSDNSTRVPATELLINTPAIGNLIRNNKIHQIPNTIQTGKEEGMHTMEMKIEDLRLRGIIPRE